MPLRVAFYTLGCKLNQLETEAFADAFAREGAIVVPFDSDLSPAPDLVVVNTCTVTNKAEAKARRAVRLALAGNRDGVVLITGCYAEVEAESLAALDERALVLPGSGKELLLGLPPSLAASGLCSGLGSCRDLHSALREWLASAASSWSRVEGVGSFAYNPAAFAFHSRPALKVQDGCDNECAYCRVRIARGKSLSLDAETALYRARALEAAGRAEIVLTGVNLSQYRCGDLDFPGLLELLVAGTETIAFRLSSYEPDRVDAAFLAAFAHPRVRPHLHLALQSGADPVLAAMGRRYNRADIVAAVDSLRRARRDPFIAVDLISGFPGETEADAAATLELARDCDFAWIHAFRFSPRPGTPAASMPDRVPERLTTDRVEALRGVGREGRATYIERWIGAEVSAVLEKPPVASQVSPSLLAATTENYLKLRIRGLPEGSRPGQPIACRIVGKRVPSDPEEIDAFALYIGVGRSLGS